MASRGRRGPPRPRRWRGQAPRQEFESEELGVKELDAEGKTIIIELKSNEQGKFVKILETQGRAGGRIILSSGKAFQLRSILNEFVAEYERLPPAEDPPKSERLKTETFSQGRRRYYVDLRQNDRGRFLKLTMLAGGKTYVAIPAESLSKFRDNLASLLDEHCQEGEESDGEGPSPRPRQQPREPRQRQGTPPPPAEKVLPSKEVRAGGKRFYFDVEQNDRGTFIKLSEVRNLGGRNRINIPQSCWTKMGEAFSSYAKDLPYASGEEDSGSEEN